MDIVSTISVRIGASKFNALKTTGQLVVASPKMINRVNYADGSITNVYEDCRALAEATYMEQILWRVNDYGNPRVLYCLNSLGYKELISRGVDRSTLVRPSSNRLIKSLPLTHFMAANELIVQALELAKNDPLLKVKYVPEPILRRRPLEKAGYTLVPDAWVQCKRGTGEATYLFELDRSSIPLERIEPRIHGYLALDQSREYEERFHTLGLVVVWVVADGNKDRLEALRKLVRGILGPNHPQSDLFLFGLSDSSYFDEAWYFADEAPPQTLLPLSWRANGKTKT